MIGFDDFVDDQQRIKTPKKNCRRKNKKSKNKSSSTTATQGRRTGFPAKPLDFSALLNVSYVICIICVVCAVFIDNQAMLTVNDFIMET
jgi:hypothetical protein